MNESDETHREQAGAAGERPSKKPYHKPEARFQRVFETQALSCGKTHSRTQNCKSLPKNS